MWNCAVSIVHRVVCVHSVTVYYLKCKIMLLKYDGLIYKCEMFKRRKCAKVEELKYNWMKCIDLGWMLNTCK